MTSYLLLDDLALEGRTVLVRSDLNVPMEDGEISDEFRILAAIPTYERLLERGAWVRVCSHLGRPKGRDPSLSLAPVASRIAEITGWEVGFDEGEGPLTVMENTRFLDGETSNDPETARLLARDADLFVQDAFGSVHRAHASTVGVAEILRSSAGPLLNSEVTALGRFLNGVDRPFSVVLGGAKVSDKLGVLENLLPKVDHMLIGGGMCFTFIAATGGQVGDSLVEEDKFDVVSGLMAGDHASKLMLPTDVVAGDRFEEGAESRVMPADAIQDGWLGLDIGPEASTAFAERISASTSVFWNGPMGVFEWHGFRDGTEAVARAMGEASGFSAVGGGDSVAALRELGLDDTVSHVSTGGGAGLELLEGQVLPGIAVLERWVE
ncbi:MAG: phosphoglycerate kinase [Acidimicrobiia bacterium]